jgi:hypothetical protein
MKNAVRELAKLTPIPSGHNEEASLAFDAGTLVLNAIYVRDGKRYSGGFRFSGARAFRYRAEGHCTAWHIEAYNSLVAVDHSDWLNEILGANLPGISSPWDLQHFMVYVEDDGAYEVAAEYFEQLEESNLS